MQDSIGKGHAKHTENSNRRYRVKMEEKGEETEVEYSRRVFQAW